MSNSYPSDFPTSNAVPTHGHSLSPRDAKLLAEADAANAQALASRAQADWYRSQSAVQDVHREMQLISLDEQRRKETETMAADAYNGVIHFPPKPIDFNVAYSVLASLAFQNRTREGQPIEIILCSGGGSIIPGLMVHDYIRTLVRGGTEVTVTALGMAASMASVILQAGSKRRMSAESWLMIHEGSSAMEGTIGQIEDSVSWSTKMRQRMVDIYVSRSDGKLTADTITANWHRRDWWLSSAEALAYGLVDEVI